MTKIILLDVDGVLVHPGGYRAALRASVNHFIELMGLPHFDIPEERIAELEKRGVASEWDMTPLLLAPFWNDILFHYPIHNLPSDVSAAAIEIGRHLNGYVPRELSVPEFPMIPGQYAVESAMQHGLFPLIPTDLRTNLLSETRDVYRSQTTRIFQNYCLGSEKFTETYDLPSEVNTDSFLMIHDKPHINKAMQAKLTQSGNYPVGFTSRPSAPPREVDTSHIGYPPEAEAALEITRLANIPLIAFGKLEYLAKQYGLAPSTLVKPSPVHSLAAVSAAITGDEWSALQGAYHWHQTGQLNEAFKDLPSSFELIVVEDTLGGINSVRKTGEILKQAGFDVSTRLFGLTSGSPSKAAAFEQNKVPYFETWETLIDAMNL